MESVMPAIARWRILPLERKLHWILRLGVVGCFIGHGAYGFLTKEAWVPYFGIVDIDRAWAYRLMPWIGAMDVSLGLTMAVVPLRVVLLHLIVWGLWTAALRPLSGDSVWEFFERAGNYGVPLAFLVLAGVPRCLRRWFVLVWPSTMRPLTVDSARALYKILLVTTCLLLLGHGVLGAVNNKPALTVHYASIGLQDIAVGSLTLTRMVGGLEIVLAVAVLIAPLPNLLLGICVWKMATEVLFLTSGSLPFEWIERAGSYMAPLALYYLIITNEREGRISMLTLKRHSMRLVVMTLALLGVMALPARGDVASDGPKVGQWKTWVLASGTEIQVPAPPAETSDQTKTELAELRQLQKERSPSANTAIQYYNAVPATQRWHDLAIALARAEKQSSNRQARLTTILHTALHDAVIVTWAAKYQVNRKPPSQMAPDVTPAVLITGAVPAPEPSYPSEHAALAGTAVGILTSFFPKEEANLQAMAAEEGQTRLLMGANYRSDVDAGFALGQVVAQKALARAATDGADAKWTGTIPTGPGMWVGKDPLEPLMGTWKPWLLTRGDQFRPEPPPAFDSAVFQEELALLKRINSSPTPSQRAIATNFAAKGLEFVWEAGYALVRRERLSVPREVRLLASFGVLQWDAYIAAHDAKYTYWRLRPNMADTTIVPLIPVPNHPAYVSNAAIISSAVAALVGAMFPQEAAQWQYLGEEAGLSRIYAGIHYPSDERVGNQMGQNLAALAIQRDQLNGQ